VGGGCEQHSVDLVPLRNPSSDLDEQHFVDPGRLRNSGRDRGDHPGLQIEKEGASLTLTAESERNDGWNEAHV
jgi:hypothetical protein